MELETPQCRIQCAEQPSLKHTEASALPISAVRRYWLPCLPVLFVVSGAAALAVDCPLAQWCLHHHRNWPEYAEELFQFGESFANGLGAAVFILAAFQLAPARRRAIPRVIAIVVAAAIAADLVKLLVMRTRPYGFDFAGGVWATFGQWFSVHVDSVDQSFPSGHTAVAVALAIALAWHYPRGAWLVAALALLAACQRLQCGAHYLSDVLFSAAVGSAAAVVCLSIGPIARWFDQWESRGKVVFVGARAESKHD
jgi:membrane-associated phospholipid phosphatase